MPRSSTQLRPIGVPGSTDPRSKSPPPGTVIRNQGRSSSLTPSAVTIQRQTVSGAASSSDETSMPAPLRHLSDEDLLQKEDVQGDDQPGEDAREHGQPPRARERAHQLRLAGEHHQ